MPARHKEKTHRGFTPMGKTLNPKAQASPLPRYVLWGPGALLCSWFKFHNKTLGNLKPHQCFPRGKEGILQKWAYLRM